MCKIKYEQIIILVGSRAKVTSGRINKQNKIRKLKNTHINSNSILTHSQSVHGRLWTFGYNFGYRRFHAIFLLCCFFFFLFLFFVFCLTYTVLQFLVMNEVCTCLIHSIIKGNVCIK